MVADYKKTSGINAPLVGILTDYAPHSYWVYDNIDAYVVPSEETGRKLADNGIPEERIRPLGVPIDPKFIPPLDSAAIQKELNLDPSKPTVLIMGGGQGMGPIKQMLVKIDRIPEDIQAMVVSGTNRKLYGWMRKRRFKKKIIPLGYVSQIERLMSAATFIVTKPGGVTTAEALAKGLPMLIINPLPGQEAINTRFLLNEGVALNASNENELAELIRWLLANPGKLRQMRQRVSRHAKPDSAVQIARLLLSF
jgi:processive 1,2-diacylglycerol beta-glucosyltransferase